ncbi:MAG: FAD-dependent oxidoreductase [Acaryochloris sp. SU_5_25]|nr:FAD-dependent oxidoreductase [Acaryochloris sp. SU_5_25]
MNRQQPIKKQLVLIGGGHSHAIALREFALHPLAGVRITLISEQINTPYSGMLPGHIAGHYTATDCHIDLQLLTQAVPAQFYVDRAIALDLEEQRVICANHPPVPFDGVSIDIGSTPQLPQGNGILDYGVPVKPWQQFLQQWQQAIDQVTQHPDQPLSLGIVGGGAGGVELTLAIQYRLHHILQGAQQPLNHLTMHLFHRGTQVMTGHNAAIGDRFHQILMARGIHLHLQETVVQIDGDQMVCESGLRVGCDRSFWVTGATAPSWLKESGLSTDEQGFIQVGSTLQSLSHPQVLAAGDIATMVVSPRPKAGVFAVRQGKPLAANLRRLFQGKSLQAYQPQSRFLSLISTGDRKALLSWGSLAVDHESAGLWRWKDAIDRQFMAQFRGLPAKVA